MPLVPALAVVLLAGTATAVVLLCAVARAVRRRWCRRLLPATVLQLPALPATVLQLPAQRTARGAGTADAAATAGPQEASLR